MTAWKQRHRGGGRGGFGGGDAFGDIFGDVFGDIFGARRGGGGRQQVFRGADLRYELELDLDQAVFGHEVEIEVPKLSECETCHGSGAAKGSSPVKCDTCDGHGQVRISQGFFQLQQTCPKCRGSGQQIKNPCDTCLGQGRVRKTSTLNVKIPAGVDTGDRIRLGGEGEAGRNGGPPGDLLRRSPRARARDLRARRRASELRSAGELRHRGAGRLGAGADAGWRRHDQGACGDAVRAASSVCATRA